MDKIQLDHKKEAVVNELKEKQAKISEYNDFSDELKSQAVRLKKYNDTLDQRSDTLDKKFMIVQSKERDLEKFKVSRCHSTGSQVYWV